MIPSRDVKPGDRPGGAAWFNGCWQWRPRYSLKWIFLFTTAIGVLMYIIGPRIQQYLAIRTQKERYGRIGVSIDCDASGRVIGAVIFSAESDEAIACEWLVSESMLERVDFISCDVTDHDIARFRNHPMLSSIAVYDSPVTDSMSETLLTLPSLRHVYIRDVSISDQSVETLSKLKRLQGLYIENTELSKGGITRLGAELSNTSVWIDGKLLVR